MISFDDMCSGRGASVSNCQKYRYTLTRSFPGGNSPLIFCMLNPSTADATVDDRTIRRCIGFAKRENAAGLIVVNLFAWRETNPTVLGCVNDPVGPENDTVLRRVASGGKRIICAWGGDSIAPYRAAPVIDMFIAAGAQLLCFGTNKDGSPKHPLYLRADTALIEYSGETQHGRRGRGQRA